MHRVERRGETGEQAGGLGGGEPAVIAEDRLQIASVDAGGDQEGAVSRAAARPQGDDAGVAYRRQRGGFALDRGDVGVDLDEDALAALPIGPEPAAGAALTGKRETGRQPVPVAGRTFGRFDRGV